MIEIWHNPRCSKSRDSLKVVEESGEEVKVFKYLDETVSIEDIKAVLLKLKIPAQELLRTKEEIYKELNLKDVNDETKIIDAMSRYPKLIERPIIIKNGIAVIGRPIEKTINLLND